MLAGFFWLAASSVWAAPGQAHPPDKYVTPIETADILVKGKERPFLLDVRNDWEYGDYHIPGAANIPVQVLGKPENLAKLPKGRKILLYCRTGVRADRALSILSAKGFNAVSIKGGVAAWWREVIQPPSITMVPFGKHGADFRKRQGLRNYFMKIPGAGAAFATPAGPPIKKAVKAILSPKVPTSVVKPKTALPQPCAVGGPPNLGNPCG
jgi:rhodanese-related sulfurtransferase